VPCNSFADFLNAEGVFSLTGERRYDWADEDARIHRSTTGVFKADVGFEHHAAVEVSWFGARDFCRWRGRRLPSEASGRRRREARTSAHIPWAGSRPRRNAPSSVTATTRPRVGTPPCRPQPPRAEDLQGNLRQWTSSILRPYPVPAREEGLAAQERVVLRGASHDDPIASLSISMLRSYDRRGAAAGHRDVGFRCATSEDLEEIAR
jgi:formylglycine-generating enzyme required for sulfatase activity